MSKKSTNRTENDGNIDHCSSNDKSLDSERGKSDLYSNLPFGKEINPGASGDYSSSRKVLTQRLSEKLKSELNCVSTNNSSNSLDEELYGVNDAFSRNLEYLKQKLCLLNFSETNKTSPEDYLSTRENFIDLNVEESKVEQESAIGTASEPSQAWGILENGVDSYRVPFKKVCRRGTTPKSHVRSSKTSLSSVLTKAGTTQDKNYDLNNLPQLTRTERCYAASVKKKCLREKTPRIQNELQSSQATPISFSRTIGTQFEEVNVLNTFRSTKTSWSESSSTNGSDPVQSTRILELKLNLPLNLTGSSTCTSNISSIEASTRSVNENEVTCKITPDRILSSVTNVIVNLPSSVDDYFLSSTNNIMPLEPKIVVLERNNFEKVQSSTKIFGSDKYQSPKFKSIISTKKIIKLAKRGKVTPIIKDDEFSSENEQILLNKYYEDSTEVSSNPYSTPTVAISTCASRSSSFPQADSSESSVPFVSKRGLHKVVYQNRKHLRRKSDLLCDNLKRGANLKNVNPSINSSLDIPKVLGCNARRTYIFPAITKITSFVGNFSFGDTGGCLIDEDVEKGDAAKCTFRDTARCLLIDSSKTSKLSDRSSKNSTVPAEGSLKHVTTRKVQSTDMSFYSVESFEDLVESNSIRMSETEDDEVIINDNERYWNSCCLNMFFHARRTHFFT